MGKRLVSCFFDSRCKVTIVTTFTFFELRAWDRQTDNRMAALLNAPYVGRVIITSCYSKISAR